MPMNVDKEVEEKRMGRGNLEEESIEDKGTWEMVVAVMLPSHSLHPGPYYTSLKIQEL